MVGENSSAISHLTHLLQTPYNSWLYGPPAITPALLRLDPVWDPLCADPAFRKTLRGKATLNLDTSARFPTGTSRKVSAAQINDLKIGDFNVRPGKFGVTPRPISRRGRGAAECLGF